MQMRTELPPSLWLAAHHFVFAQTNSLGQLGITAAG